MNLQTGKAKKMPLVVVKEVSETPDSSTLQSSSPSSHHSDCSTANKQTTHLLDRVDTRNERRFLIPNVNPSPKVADKKVTMGALPLGRGGMNSPQSSPKQQARKSTSPKENDYNAINDADADDTPPSAMGQASSTSPAIQPSSISASASASNSTSTHTSASSSTSSSNFQSRLWATLFQSVSSSIDELYLFIEDTGSAQRCLDAVDLLNRSHIDFVKLVERIQEQQRFIESSTDGAPASISWEVRKPTQAIARANTDTNCDSGNLGGNNNNTKTKLRATASPFTPSSTVTVLTTTTASSSTVPPTSLKTVAENANETETLLTSGYIAQKAVPTRSPRQISTAPIIPTPTPDSAISPAPVPSISTSTSTVTDIASSAANATATAKSPRPSSISQPLVKATSTSILATGPTDKKKKSNSTTAIVNANANVSKLMTDIVSRSRSMSISSTSSNPHSASSTASSLQSSSRKAREDSDRWDSATEAEYVKASEQVWAEAEAWIEAEAAVEEAAWEVLAAASVSPEDEGEGWSSQAPSKKEERVSKKTHKVLPRPLFENEWEGGRSVIQHTRTPSPSHILAHTPSPGVSTLLSICTSPARNCSPHSANPSAFSTPSSFNSSSSSSSSSSSAQRSLHDKLSSPERAPLRKSFSPSEAKRRQEAKQLLAEVNRDRANNEKKQRALVTLNRVRMHGEKEAKKLQEAEQRLEERLSEAVKRHDAYIQVIKSKAGNENQKVSEVAFINSINSEGVAEELQRKLEEVEARIVAAAQRRQERIQGQVSIKQSKWQKKSEQMSELRMRLEKVKAERWEKLQNKLETVNKRRMARLKLTEPSTVAHEFGAPDSSPLLPSSSSTLSCPKPSPSSLSVDITNDQQSLDAAASLAINADIIKERGTNTPAPAPAPTTSDVKSTGEDQKKDKEKGREKDKKKKKEKKKGSTTKIDEDIDEIIRKINSTKESPCSAPPASSSKADTPSSISVRPTLAFQLKGWRALKHKKGASNARSAALDAALDDPHIASTPLEGALRALEKIVSADKAQTDREIIGLARDLKDWLVKSHRLSPSSSSSTSSSAPTTSIALFPPQLIAKAITVFTLALSKPTIGVFISSGGITLLRIILGPEVGLLSSEEAIQQVVEGDIFLVSARALQACSSVAKGRDYILSTGSAVLVVDLVFMALSHLEQWRKSKLYTGGSGEVGSSSSAAAAAPPPPPAPAITVTSATAVVATGGGGSSSSPSKTCSIHTWPNEALFLPPLLSVINVIMRHQPHKNTTLSASPSKAEQNSLLEWVFYFFASGVVKLVCQNLFELQQLTAEVTDQELPYTFTTALLSAIGGVASFLRVSAGVSVNTLVESTAQLASKKHLHTRGREMVSLLRTSEVVPSLISFLSNLLLEGAQNRRSLTSRDDDYLSATVSTLSLSVLEALTELATVDISLIHRLPSDLQMSIAHSSHRLLRSLLYCEQTMGGSISCTLSTSTILGGNGFDTSRHRPSSSSSSSSSSLSGTKTATFSLADRNHCIDVLLGFLCVVCINNIKMQTFVGHGPAPTLLTDLLHLPIKYFVNASLKRQLLPTLVSACIGCETNLQVLRTEVSDKYLTAFLSDAIRQMKSSLAIGSSEYTSLCLLSHRLPVELWMQGLKEFSPEGTDCFLGDDLNTTHSTDIFEITMSESEFYRE